MLNKYDFFYGNPDGWMVEIYPGLNIDPEPDYNRYSDPAQKVFLYPTIMNDMNGIYMTISVLYYRPNIRPFLYPAGYHIQVFGWIFFSPDIHYPERY